MLVMELIFVVFEGLSLCLWIEEENGLRYTRMLRLTVRVDGEKEDGDKWRREGGKVEVVKGEEVLR